MNLIILLSARSLRRLIALCALPAVLATVLVVGLTTAPGTAAAADTLTRDQLANLLRQVLRDDPNIILDVLRENSEIVLDVAQQGSNQRRLKALNAQWKKDIDIPKPVALANRPILGNPDAPVTIVAFSDFTCPYCSQAAQTISTLLRDNKGKIRVIFKHFPLAGHKSANMAAEYFVAASFQSTEKAWALHDILFQQGERLNEEGEVLIKRSAEQAGLDMKKLAADLRNSASKIKAVIEEDAADAKQLGLQGTPNFLVNNLIVRGALAPELFSQAVNMAYEHSRNRPK